MDPSERSALAMHLDYGHMNLESPARPVALDGRPIEGITDPLPFVVMALGSEFTENKSRLKLLEHSISEIYRRHVARDPEDSVGLSSSDQ